MFSRNNRVPFGKALPVQVSHRFAAESAVFDDGNLVSSAGLVPVMRLAEQTGLSRLLGEKVHIIAPRITSGSANPAPKLATVVAGMVAGADCIDDLDVVRSGRMRTPRHVPSMPGRGLAVGGSRGKRLRQAPSGLDSAQGGKRDHL